MTRGSKPKPTEDKRRLGTLRADRSHEDEVKFDPLSSVKAPEILSEEGLKEWERIIPQLQSRGILNETDHSILLAYCIEMQRYFEACEDIKAKGTYERLTNKNDTEYFAVNPSVTIAKTSLLSAIRIATEFGFTPSSRTRISVTNAKKNENPDADTLLRLTSNR